MKKNRLSERILFSYKIFVNNVRENFIVAVLELSATLGSVVTIYTSYFDHEINLNSYKDLGIISFIVFIFIVFIFKIVRQLKSERLVLKKNTFFEYVNRKLLHASSVINIAGDLSWLEKQYDVFKTLRENGCPVKIFYCDNGATQTDCIAIQIQNYKELGIQMIPYPTEMEPHHKSLKGLIIDNGEEDLKFYSFMKKDDEGLYMRCSLYKNNAPELKIVQAYINSLDIFVNLLDRIKVLSLPQKEINKNMLIGVSGLNNIGKSTLCRQMIKEFGEDVVELIPDTFIQHSGKSDLEIALFCISIQMTIFNRVRYEKSSKKIYIFDRTPIDNLAFLLVYMNQLKKKHASNFKRAKTVNIEKYSSEWDEYLTKLELEMEMFMKHFDLVALLVPQKKEDWINLDNQTSAVSNDIRSSVLKEIDRLCKKMAFIKLDKYLVSRFETNGLEQNEIDKKIEERISVIVSEIKSKVLKK